MDETKPVYDAEKVKTLKANAYDVMAEIQRLNGIMRQIDEALRIELANKPKIEVVQE